MTARRMVVLLVVVTAFYIGLIGWQGVLLLGADSWVARGAGLGVLLLPVVGVAVVAREVRFGRDTERLARLLAARGEAGGDSGGPDLPAGVDLPRRPSGRVDRAAADAAFARRRAEVEADPEDWRTWYHLAVAYGDAGDTRRGRGAMRHAIALVRAQRAHAA